jgi:hypothetical protein
MEDYNNDKHMGNGQTSKYGPRSLVTTEVADGRNGCSVNGRSAAHQPDKLIIHSFVWFNVRYNHTLYLNLSLPYCCLIGTVRRLGECCFNKQRQTF